MYLQHIKLTDIKGFRDIELTLPGRGGWYVILGENGTGKSTLLQAIGLALAGRERDAALLPDAKGWVTDGRPQGSCYARVQLPFQPSQPSRIDIEYRINSLPTDDKEYGFVSRPSILFKKMSPETARRLYSEERGFLVAGYGPFRRLAEPSSGSMASPGGDDPLASLFYPNALTDCEELLRQLDYRRKAESAPPKLDAVFTAVVGFVNQLLPRPFQIVDVQPDGVVFSGPGVKLSLGGLSDGYRTMFGLAVDLLRKMALSALPGQPEAFQQDDEGNWVVTYPGVVLIDEVEAHLHPQWQREVGFYMKRVFPHIQFIIATHSPFVAQAAEEDGIFVLRRRESEGFVSVDATLDSLRGWRAEQILSSPAFGLETTRDLETEELMRRHENLRARQLSGLELTEQEKHELAHLTQRLQNVLPRAREVLGERTP